MVRSRSPKKHGIIEILRGINQEMYDNERSNMGKNGGR